MLLRRYVVIAISHLLVVDTLAELFDIVFDIVLVPIYFSKLLKDYLRASRNQEIFCVAL
jgi:hypothetical protein